MRIFAIVLGMTSVTLLTAATPDSASAKCGVTPTVRGTAMVLDGQKLGQVVVTDYFDTRPVHMRFDWGPFIDGKTIVFSNIGCWTERDPVTGGWAVQESFDVLTTDYLGLTLARMEGFQSAHWTAHRQYAGSLSELGSLVPVDEVKVSLRATETGWSAAIHHVFNIRVNCHLAVRDPELILPGQTHGQVLCIDKMPMRIGA
jgi:hypothetical protein